MAPHLAGTSPGNFSRWPAVLSPAVAAQGFSHPVTGCIIDLEIGHYAGGWLTCKNPMTFFDWMKASAPSSE